MATITKRGLATVEGTTATFDVILYPVMQKMSMSHEADEETVKDVRGFDASWLFRNMHKKLMLGAKIVGDTLAHAKTGGDFLALGSAVVISACDLTILNGTYSVKPSGKIDLTNTAVGDIEWNLCKYDDATQNTASVTTPS